MSVGQVQETIDELQEVLLAERDAVMAFDTEASGQAAERKLELSERLRALLTSIEGQGAAELQPSLEELQRRMQQNHRLLGFAQQAVRGALAALTGTQPPAVYNPRGTLAPREASLMKRVV